MKCLLPKTINECTYLELDTMECLNPNFGCGFQQDEDDIKEIKHKKEKWFEKYYKK